MGDSVSCVPRDSAFVVVFLITMYQSRSGQCQYQPSDSADNISPLIHLGITDTSSNN